MTIERKKPIPKHPLFSVYWWNPLIYLMLIMVFPILLIAAIFEAVNEYYHIIKNAIQTWDWN